MSFLLNPTTLAQIKIEEEVILDSQLGIEAVPFTMPFYGKVSGCVNWGAMWWGTLKDVVITAGNQTVTRGFGCSAGYTICEWAIQGVPLGTIVNITVYGSCDNNGNLIEAQTQLIYTGTNQYTINYLDQWGNFSFATTISFIEQTPPLCDFACSEQLDTQMPIAYNMHVDESLLGYDPCDYSNEPNEIRVGCFGMINGDRGSDINELTVNDLNVCFDEQTQKWEFDILTAIINLRLVNLFCRDNIENRLNADIIYGIQEIGDVNCYKLKKAIEGHKIYPPENIQNGIVFAEIIYAHENLHESEWNKYKVKYYNNYLNIPNKIKSYRCSEFTTLGAAKSQILSDIKDLFMHDFWNKIYKDYHNNQFLYSVPNDTEENRRENERIKENRRKLEINHHKRSEVAEVIFNYERFIYTQYCN